MKRDRAPHQTKVTDWKRLGISADPDPIRLGGCERLPALRGLLLSLPGLEAGTRLSLDWVRLADEALLTPRERAVFLAYWRDQIPKSHLGLRLNLTRTEVSSLFSAMMAKVTRDHFTAGSRFAPLRNSLRPFHKTYVGPGRYLWDLAELGESFQEIMMAERNFYCLESSVTYNQKRKKPEHLSRVSREVSRSFRSYMKNSIELNERLAAEKLKRGRLQGRIQVAETAVRQAEDNLDEIEQGLKASRVQAALDEKEWPDEAALRQLAPARAALTEAKAARDAARQADVKQEAIVSGILAEIHACRLEAFAAEVAPRKVAFNRVLAELVEEELAICNLAGDARYNLTTFELAAALSPLNPSQPDSLSRALESRERSLAFNAVLALARFGRR